MRGTAASGMGAWLRLLDARGIGGLCGFGLRRVVARRSTAVLAVLAMVGACFAVAGAGPANADVGSDLFSPVVPVRILDTRSGLGEPGGLAAPVGAQGIVALQVTGVGGVPAGVDAVVMNVTAVHPTASTYVAVYQGDVGRRRR